MFKIILSIIAMIFAIAAIIINIITIKKIKNINQNFDEKIEKLSKKEKRKSKTNKMHSEFIDEVVNILFNKKLYPMVRINDQTHYIEVLHQNPGSTDTFTVIDCLEFPSKSKGTNEWKRCVALVEEAIDDFIELHSQDIASGKIIMEEMPKDVIYK